MEGIEVGNFEIVVSVVERGWEETEAVASWEVGADWEVKWVWRVER